MGSLRRAVTRKYVGEAGHTAQYLGFIERSGRHLLEIVNGVLDFSKLEAGKLELKLSRIDVAALLRNVVEPLTDLARKRA